MLTLRPGPACISVDVSAVADAHRSDKTNPTRNASAQTFFEKTNSTPEVGPRRRAQRQLAKQSHRCQNGRSGNHNCDNRITAKKRDFDKAFGGSKATAVDRGWPYLLLPQR